MVDCGTEVAARAAAEGMAKVVVVKAAAVVPVSERVEVAVAEGEG